MQITKSNNISVSDQPNSLIDYNLQDSTKHTTSEELQRRQAGKSHPQFSKGMKLVEEEDKATKFSNIWLSKR